MSGSYGAWWDGIPLAAGPRSPVRYVRTRGFEPSVSTVTTSRRYFQSLTAARPVDPFARIGDQSPALLGLLDSPVPVTFQPIAAPPFVGDLVFAQGPADARRVFRAKQLYLAGARIVDPSFDPPDVEFTLVDIRKWWENYGEVTETWNESLAGSGAVKVTADRLIVRSPERAFAAHTAREGGRQPKTLREIVQSLLNRLPGKLQIAHWPAKELAAPFVRAWGASPKEVLVALFDAFQLELDVGADLRARVFAFGEGVIGEGQPGDADNTDAYDPISKHGVWRDQLTADGDRYTRRPTGMPDEVLVVGDRTIFDVQVDYLTPVLVYTHESKDAPPRTVVAEVTPTILDALARGVRAPEELHGERPDAVLDPSLLRTSNAQLAGSELSQEDRFVVQTLLGVETPKLPNLVDGPLAPRELGRRDSFESAPDPLAWQRLPFADEEEWSRTLPWLPEGARVLIRSQLWRYYQVPEKFRRLLPFLKRAETDYKGDRLEPLVEAFSFRRVSTRVRKPDKTEEKKEKAKVDRARKVEQLEVIRAEQERLRKVRKELQAPTLVEVSGAVQDMVRSAIDVASVVDIDLGLSDAEGGFAPTVGVSVDPEAALKVAYSWAERGPITQGDPTDVIDKAVESLQQIGRGWLEQIGFAKGGTFDPETAGVAEKLAAGVLFRTDVEQTAGKAVLGEGATAAQIEERLKQIDQQIAFLAEEEHRVLLDLNPRLALEQELGAVEAEIASLRAASGVVSKVLRAKADKLQEKIAAEKQVEIEERKPRAQEAEFEDLVYHIPMPRHEVRFRVVDAALGIIEIFGDLPGWIADPGATHKTSTYFLPMPVRITFGSWNRFDVDLSESTELPENFYMKASLRMARSLPNLAPLLGRMGHVVPANPGEEAARFTFSRNQARAGGGVLHGDDSGRATIGPFPWRVLVDDRDTPLRLLVRLGGKNNRAEILKRARAHAAAFLDAPKDVDSGSLTALGPRSVHLNGKTSAVEIRDTGDGFVTEVSFESDVAPLPGVEGRSRVDAGPTRLQLGIDVEGRRDR